MKFPVFDLHCDTPLALLGEDYRQCGSLKKNNGHIDLDRAAVLDGYAQCFACFTTTDDEFGGIPAVEIFERELASILREIERNQDTISLVYSSNDIEENYKKNKISAILSIEGPAGFGYDPMLLSDLYALGFRISTLGWNEKNPLTGSHITGGGLSDLGREYVKEAQRLGMIVDVSHISDQGFWDILEMAQSPVIASHSNSRNVHNISRNLSDDMFLTICQNGGIVGINLYGEFLGENPTLDTVADHILHFLELDPTGKHIALGGDLDGCDILPVGFSGIQSYPDLASTLLLRGVGEEMVADIFWNNGIGVIKQCCI